MANLGPNVSPLWVDRPLRFNLTAPMSLGTILFMSPLRTTFLIMLTVSSVMLPACAGNGRPDVRARDEDRIRMLVERFLASVNGADTKAFVGFFADDATAFLPTNAARRVGVAEIEAAVAPVFDQGPRANPATAGDLRIFISGRLAIATFDAGSGELHARRTLIFDRVKDEWKIVHLHASNVSAAH